MQLWAAKMLVLCIRLLRTLPLDATLAAHSSAAHLAQLVNRCILGDILPNTNL